LTNLKTVEPLLAVASEHGYDQLATALETIRQRLAGE
jgi:hypothetical protein